MLDFKRVLAAAPKVHEGDVLQPLLTPWGEHLNPDSVLPEHPRPQMARENVRILNGWWDCAFVASDNAQEEFASAKAPQSFDMRILVPFSPEAQLSQVNRQLKPNELLWYRTDIDVDLNGDEHAILHFDAVDYACACYCNGTLLGTHKGGYLPFEFDITHFVENGRARIELCVFDPSETGTQLRGKQSLSRGNIWYTAQSGIWKTVWLETVPAAHVTSLILDASLRYEAVRITASVCGNGTLTVRVLEANGDVVGESSEKIDHESGEKTVEVFVSVPDPHLWSCEDPYLYPMEIQFGEDEIKSYCAFRTVEVASDDDGVSRLFLNGAPLLVKGVLDQGYWPDGLMTAPADEALVFDIKQMKALGFNMMRKHIKIESARWYYHCDKLGMLVWQDMVSGGGTYDAWHTSRKPTLVRRSWTRCADDDPKRFKDLSADDPEYRDEWLSTCFATVKLLHNHPCIITWVLFNEGWGQFEARKADYRVHKLDHTRPIDATSGWYDQRCGNFFSVHDYFRPLTVYPAPKSGIGKPVKSSKLPVWDPRAFALSEFGGLSYHVDGHSSLERSYGYDSFANASEFRDAVIDKLANAEALESRGLAVYVYTQLSDVEEETNGILTYDRRVNKLSTQ